MNLAQALTIAVILASIAFVLWGRSASGRAVLTRLFGAPSPPRRSGTRSEKRAAAPAARSGASGSRSGASGSRTKNAAGASQKTAPRADSRTASNRGRKQQP